MNNIIRIPIGDWSDDGHGKCKSYYILSNYDVSTLRQAYKDSCKLMGVQFNHNENYTGLKLESWNDPRQICSEYEDSMISDTAIEIFKQYECPFKNVLEGRYFDGTDDFVEVLLWFISKSMPSDFQWEFLKHQTLNGYWNNELNCQFGYGLFC